MAIAISGIFNGGMCKSDGMVNVLSEPSHTHFIEQD